MNPTVQKHDPVRLSIRRLIMVALFLLVLFGIVGVWNAYQKERESSALKLEAQNGLADLQHQETQLENNITQLKSDRGREEILRNRYEVGKEGENLIIIVDPDHPQPVEASSTILQRIKKAIWLW